VVPLVGQNSVKLTPTGTSDVENDQLVTTFDNIPDRLGVELQVGHQRRQGRDPGRLGRRHLQEHAGGRPGDRGSEHKGADADVFIQTPACPLRVISKKVGKSTVVLKVGGLGAGKVTVTGKNIKKTTKTITRSTVATITAKRTKGTPGKVKVSFLPKGAKKALTTSATLK
jgi:hypothetical protein